jgi:HNH endonuclease
MSKNIPNSIRLNVFARAEHRCEYCQILAEDSFYGFQIDHIFSRKHGGLTELINLALACPDCNRNKGTDLGTFLIDFNNLVRFFNPRLDDWNHHFTGFDTGLIEAKTPIAEATVKILDINHPDRIIERALLFRLERWPKF